MSFTHTLEVARRKAGGGPDWNWIKIRRVGDDATLVVGGIRGSPKREWSPEVAVMDSEADAEERAYEERTGRCGECLGVGQIIAGVSRENGASYRECPKCKGTGSAE